MRRKAIVKGITDCLSKIHFGFLGSGLVALAACDSLLQLFGFGGDELIVGSFTIGHNVIDATIILCQHPDSTPRFG